MLCGGDAALWQITMDTCRLELVALVDLFVPHFMRIAFSEFSHRHFAENQVRSLLCYHDDGGVRITRDNPRHNRGVDYTEFLHSANPTHTHSGNNVGCISEIIKSLAVKRG